jgi:DNA-binding transcriptional LysR family regulator
MSDALKLEEFEKVMQLQSSYELQPGKTYLLVADGRHFNYEHVNALLARLREQHPDIHVSIIATTAPKGLELHEKKGDLQP